MSVDIKNLTRRHHEVGAGSVFSTIAADVLPDWDISLVFVGPKQAQELNKKLRDKTYIPNVLSYTVGEKSGEIFICPSEADKQASDFKLPASSFLLLLFIHGLLHIKGMAHGATMEACEQKLLSFYGTTHSDRNRHRHVPDQDGRRRGAHR
ncbi:MAG: rRNA maturation RNase YbeY [Candidatus Paceibacterota bacterium]|jgi:probable rRNA maturation factor